ncbi:MAG: hypothetical protein VZR64_04110 [Eubacterium sp.]|nr:hypothetical protein [Eubacterium sp.]
MYYGEDFLERSESLFSTFVETTELEAACKAASEAHERQLQQIIEESRLRQIEMFRRMKAEHPESSAVQELCDKQLAQLEAEGTGA